MQSTMFLTSVTCIDHAFIDPLGRVVGGSFSPDFWVTGEQDKHEKVVIDFSKCKKQIKAVIDDSITGYDHKLWIIPGFSNCEYQIDPDSKQIKITTPVLEIEAPDSIVKVWERSFFAESGYNPTYSDFDLELIHYLQKHIPGVTFSVGLNPQKQYTIPNNLTPSFFRYSHGLKDSSSWGCQNIAHGHLSYVAIDCDNLVTMEVQQDIANTINNTMFVYRENWDDTTNTISYTSERGTFKAKILSDQQQIVLCDTETTVENLVELIASEWSDDLREIGARAIYVSEGVHKGACKLL